MGEELSRNILVISDLHLGEDLRPGGASVSYLRHLVVLERELEAFLAYHAHARLDGRPWTLVVNGDMVDFMSVMILPDKARAAEESGLDHEDQRYGLGFGESQSRQKLERVMARHAAVFRRLADFIAAGHELVIVVGNHDFEFHYPTVQRTLVEALSAFAVEGATEEGRAAFARRIQFCPWFYYRENLVYIEHGHQYDEYCSFDYLLHPVAEPRGRRGGRKSRIALSIAHAGMRYFANQLPHYDPRTAELWSPLHYARWAWAQGLRGAIRLSYFYGLLVWRLVELWYALVDRRVDSERRAVHRERLRALSAHWQIAEEHLLAIDSLRRTPVTRRLTKLLSALFLDRLLLGGLVALAGLLAAVRLGGAWRALVPVALVGAFLGCNALLNRVRLESSSGKLRAAVRAIRRVVRAPVIVFGHSHEPEHVRLDGEAVYVNTGTWASEDLSHAFTHLLVTVAGGAPRAELRQWRDGCSVTWGKRG